MRQRKDYLAIVYGRVSRRAVRSICVSGRDPGDRRRVVASPDLGARSLTLFERVARVPAPGAACRSCAAACVTGRTHQIRVHLAARGWPIVGDPSTASRDWSSIADAALAALLHGFPRQALHAWRLELMHPATRERITLESPVPTEMAVLLRRTGLGLPASGFGLQAPGFSNDADRQYPSA